MSWRIPPDVNSGGTFRNVPPLLSHRSLYAVCFDGYVASLTKVLTETEFYAFAEKALVLPEVKGLLMEAVNEHNKNEFGGD